MDHSTFDSSSANDRSRNIHSSTRNHWLNTTTVTQHDMLLQQQHTRSYVSQNHFRQWQHNVPSAYQHHPQCCRGQGGHFMQRCSTFTQPQRHLAPVFITQPTSFPVQQHVAQKPSLRQDHLPQYFPRCTCDDENGSWCRDEPCAGTMAAETLSSIQTGVDLSSTVSTQASESNAASSTSQPTENWAEFIDLIGIEENGETDLTASSLKPDSGNEASAETGSTVTSPADVSVVSTSTDAKPHKTAPAKKAKHYDWLNRASMYVNPLMLQKTVREGVAKLKSEGFSGETARLARSADTSRSQSSSSTPQSPPPPPPPPAPTSRSQKRRSWSLTFGDDTDADVDAAPQKRGRGRPKGSRNKPKTAARKAELEALKARRKRKKAVAAQATVPEVASAAEEEEQEIDEVAELEALFAEADSQREGTLRDSSPMFISDADEEMVSEEE